MIKKEDLIKYSAEVLELFKREDIQNIEGLQKKLGRSFTAERGSIKLEEKPGGSELLPTEMVLTISYIAKREGIPIEIRLNLVRNYSSIKIKSKSSQESYVLFTPDAFGNLIQNKRFYGY